MCHIHAHAQCSWTTLYFECVVLSMTARGDSTWLHSNFKYAKLKCKPWNIYWVSMSMSVCKEHDMWQKRMRNEKPHSQRNLWSISHTLLNFIHWISSESSSCQWAVICSRHSHSQAHSHQSITITMNGRFSSWHRLQFNDEALFSPGIYS